MTITIGRKSLTVSLPAPKAGEQVYVVNDDHSSHVLTLTKKGDKIPAIWTQLIQSMDVTSFAAPAAGTYVLSCPEYADLVGTLTVV